MNVIEAMQRRGDVCPFGRLLRNCEITAMASKVVEIVSNFFRDLAFSIVNCYSKLKHKIIEFMDPPIKFTNFLTTIEDLDERESFIYSVLCLISPKMETSERKAFARVVGENKDSHALVERLRPQIQEKMHSEECLELMRAIKNIPDEKIRMDVIAKTLLLINMLPGMNLTLQKTLIEAIISIPTNERDLIIESATRLLTGDSYAVSFLPIQLGNEVLQEAVTLFTNGMHIVSNTSYEDRANIVDFILQLSNLPYNPSQYFGRRFEVCLKICEIPISLRKSIIENTIRLKDYLEIDSLFAIIRNLKQTPLQEHEKLITCTLTILQQISLKISGVCNTAVPLFEALVKTPASQRDQATKTTCQKIAQRINTETMGTAEPISLFTEIIGEIGVIQ